MVKKQSLNVTEYLSGLTKDNIDEIAVTLERTPAMILQCVNILENWNSKMKTLCSSIIEVFTIIILGYTYLYCIINRNCNSEFILLYRCNCNYEVIQFP